MVKKVSIGIGSVVVIAVVVFILLYRYFEGEHKKHVVLYKDNAIAQIYPCLYRAINNEFFDRAYRSGIQYEEWRKMMGVGCEGGFETKTVVVADTSFQVQINCGDFDKHIEIKQFIFKGFLPLNVLKLDSIFRREMKSKNVRLSNVYIEYIDVKKKDTVKIGVKPMVDFYATEFEPIDILKSIGVKTIVSFEIPRFKEVVEPYQWYLGTLVFFFVGVLCILMLWLNHSISDSRLSKTLKIVETDFTEKLREVNEAVKKMEEYLNKPVKERDKEE